MAAAAPIALIVGLGNPGDRYTQTRHNAGFWFVEELARRYGGSFRSEAKFQGETARIVVGGQDCHLLKPMTFMNRSGASVAALARFYRIPPEQILIAHDEIDLPPGQVKMKLSGGHGGHNGLRDIIQVLGSRDFWRLRIGVGHPGQKEQVVGYVLGRASAAEQPLIDTCNDLAADQAERLLAGDFERAMQTLHSHKA
ncbi:aminoacyl-tRNA hydrolase [Alkalilimnicola ehrlichii]|uniref:Peptidyl-tRNA hydrolase n=1 Tax=Alkalilimnicola ehrlichii TaxID=351052 RepID=A0A3E0X319_9GAMM|nr:aminoacyl-tRNA hydrolase [Alkalilimnicola ehrlichii]RFA31300.1 aminoacyl-tRNA hydrolase [Alkalilimnicola ehrlichii]RFA39428.1 aminoacyl-tRNA hydrolase [Alkalilimnicola ehrlichii]